ncbi:MAG TPA: glutamate-5-semialdehyde dehydrogenase [Leptospiraceae bacterium]|nr:glutamate-5-semialdehyde dehydrogenase [Spirochaetaceae bacterium]HBS03801.1 glutamate-5-semialdehyde dehydrogenase [Leptospiraceae bacterium]
MSASQFGMRARLAFREIRKTPTALRNQILLDAAAELEQPRVQQELLEANEKDLKQADELGISEALKERLTLTTSRIQSMADSLREIAAFPDPVGEVILGRTLPNGVKMVQKRVPLGVVFTVYESRPNVTIDVGALCIKSGNAAILRGGKEAIHSNIALHTILAAAVERHGLSRDCLQFVNETDRQFMFDLLKQSDTIDLVVPRGGAGLIQAVSENTSIPVVKHDKGVCNLFIDSSAPLNRASDIAINAKLQRPSVCNAIENLLIHSDFPHAAALLDRLKSAGAILLGCERTRKLFSEAAPIEDPETEYSTEYLDQRLAVKIVDSVDEAIQFIDQYGSGHSEAIISDSHEAIVQFRDSVDTAAVLVNCSTRFHDGGQMGMGAEVGISTGRMHVRGPMGVRDLTTTTYVLEGEGQVRG